MGSTDTSLWAYTLASQNIGVTQKKVLDALRMFPDATNAELAQSLGWPINRVTPRIKELRSKEFGELVLDGGKRKCKVTGNTAHAWIAKHPRLPEPFKKKPEDNKVETNPSQLF